MPPQRRAIQNNGEEAHDPESVMATRLMEMAAQMHVGSLRAGTVMLEDGRLDEARNFFFGKTKAFVGKNTRIPTIGGGQDGGGFRSDMYNDLLPHDRAALMACCNGMAKYYVAKNDFESALCWFEETQVLFFHMKFRSPQPEYDWKSWTLDLPELTYQRAVAFVGAAELYKQLGNTASYAERRWESSSSVVNFSDAHKSTPAMKRLNDMNQVGPAIHLRHPDPNTCHLLSVTNPRLQVQGSWKKLSMKPSTKTIGARQRFASFIWNSHLYVLGGWAGDMNYQFYKDFWCLDLTADETVRQWGSLPQYPVPVSALLSASMVVHREEKRAYLITGRPEVDYFDLVTEKWGYIKTTFQATEEDRRCGVTNHWPFRGNELTDATVVINKGKIYTFGGQHADTYIGCNLFMELDLATKKWRRLTGYVMSPPDADHSIPGPRQSACGWVGPCGDRIYIFLGYATRDGPIANRKPELHMAEMSYPYRDFWSWSISEGKWRRERISGSPPLSRTEMGCTFNEKLNKVIAFGGYSPSIPTMFWSQDTQCEYSYYADTFIYDYPQPEESDLPPFISTDPEKCIAPSTTTYPRWKQVLTKGFPTYRCHSHLNSDPEMGKVYLFGGYTNTDYVPSRNTFKSRPFGDVWQLRMDVPGEGGDFASVDIAEEMRTAKIGPWKRCFTCGNSGMWKRCSGACGGKAYFCGTDCQREGWREHKKTHSCRKV